MRKYEMQGEYAQNGLRGTSQCLSWYKQGELNEANL